MERCIGLFLVFHFSSFLTKVTAPATMIKNIRTMATTVIISKLNVFCFCVAVGLGIMGVSVGVGIGVGVGTGSLVGGNDGFGEAVGDGVVVGVGAGVGDGVGAGSGSVRTTKFAFGPSELTITSFGFDVNMLQ